MNIEKTNTMGKIEFSLQAVADLAGITVSSVYGVVGLIAKKSFSNPIAQLLKKEDFTDGVSVKKVKDGYDVSLYVVISKDVKIAEVANEIQKQVSYVLKKTFGIPFNVVNVYVQALN